MGEQFGTAQHGKSWCRRCPELIFRQEDGQLQGDSLLVG